MRSTCCARRTNRQTIAVQEEQSLWVIAYPLRPLEAGTLGRSGHLCADVDASIVANTTLSWHAQGDNAVDVDENQERYGRSSHPDVFQPQVVSP